MDKNDEYKALKDYSLDELLLWCEIEKKSIESKPFSKDKEQALREILMHTNPEALKLDLIIKEVFSKTDDNKKQPENFSDILENQILKTEKNKESEKKQPEEFLNILEKEIIKIDKAEKNNEEGKKSRKKWKRLKYRNGKPKEIKDVLLDLKSDRRLLSYVPDSQAIRSNIDRRGKKTLEDFKGDATAYIKSKQYGERYNAVYEVLVEYKTSDGRKRNIHAKSVDVSTTGILLRIEDSKGAEALKGSKKIRLKFEITPGSMPEGYEMKVNIAAKLARTQNGKEGEFLCGFEFEETLAQYANRTRGRYLLASASLFLFLTTFFILLMRAESIIYFKFNKYLYLYSIIAAVFLLSRYLFGALYKPVPINPNFTPGVTIIIPCFNEEEWIERTISSCMNQDYPVDKLEVIVVDDCSTDRSVEVIKATIEKFYREAERFKTKERLKYVVQEKNMGKRDALARGALMAKHELVVFVDSDSFLDPFAIRNLVQPFQDPKMGGVAGRTDVANTYTNGLTKMQSVRYYIAFRIMKAAEAYFDTVTCLSGPLSCYRKSIVLEHLDEWLNQKFLGQKATFGDDRAMTNIVLKNYRTNYQDTAICSTIVPNRYKVFLKQQMRWKRSWLRESMVSAKFIWKKEPLAAVFFYMGLVVPIAAPIIVLYNLVYVPIVNRIFPSTFLIGIMLMSLLMSFAQLFLKKSSTWIFGLLFCLFYEGVLLWQMPVAWFTFWKSTWGTRMTPEDVKEQEKKAEKQKQKEIKKNKSKAAAQP